MRQLQMRVGKISRASQMTRSRRAWSDHTQRDHPSPSSTPHSLNGSEGEQMLFLLWPCAIRRISCSVAIVTVSVAGCLLDETIEQAVEAVGSWCVEVSVRLCSVQP